jgi:hypothetical protein
MKPRHVIGLSKVEPPTADRAGSAVLTMTLSRGQLDPVRVMAIARSDYRGRAVTIQSGTGPEWNAGLTFAAFRWSPGDGPAELLLSWRDGPPAGSVTWRESATDPPPADLDPPPLDGLNYAEVSDVLLLATDPTARWAVRAFLDAIPPIGRLPGLTTITNDDEITKPVQKMRAAGLRITQATLAAFSGQFTVDELRGYLRINGKRWRDILHS